MNFANKEGNWRFSCVHPMLSAHLKNCFKSLSFRLGSGAEREIEDIMLSRYACYLIVQNADPNKEIVALGQTYFAVQKRKQELQEEFESLSEDKKRLAIRNELKEHNKSLAEAAQNAGATFLNV